MHACYAPARSMMKCCCHEMVSSAAECRLDGAHQPLYVCTKWLHAGTDGSRAGKDCHTPTTSAEGAPQWAACIPSAFHVVRAAKRQIVPSPRPELLVVAGPQSATPYLGCCAGEPRLPLFDVYAVCHMAWHRLTLVDVFVPAAVLCERTTCHHGQHDRYHMVLQESIMLMGWGLPEASTW